MNLENHFFIFRGDTKCPTDAYVSALHEQGFKASHFPVLVFNFINLPEFAQALRNFEYGAMIISSPRVIQALEIVLKGNENLRNKFKFLPCIAIGPKTYDLLQKINENILLDNKKCNVNNANQLADYIIQHKNDFQNILIKGLYMPTSDIGREELHKRLSPFGVSVKKFVCYETKPNCLINEQLNEFIIQNIHNNKTIFNFVTFSPSGVDTLVQQVKCISLNQVRWIAIGPTTKSRIHEHSLSVFVTLSEPTPHSLIDAIDKLKLTHV